MRQLGSIAVAVIATLVALAAAEIGLRLFAGGLLAETGRRDTGSPYAFYRYDAALGWSNIPGARGRLTRSEFSHEVRINSHGLRGPETSREKPHGVRRVAVLGDSYTWGVGASETELFTSLVEKRLPGTQVLNFGVSGYSPVQHHLLTEKVLSFDPDVVVIVFCLGNDFIDNVQWRRYRYYKPFARLDGQGEVVLDGYPIPFAKRQLQGENGTAFYERSYVFRLLDKAVLSQILLFNDFGQKGVLLDEGGSDFYRPGATPEVDLAVRINAGLFKMIASAYATRRVPLLVVAGPTKCEYGRCFPDLPQPTDRALRHLQASLAGLGVRLVDPTRELTLDDFWVQDTHWRPSGHKKIADALVPHLSELLNVR
jgi:GDSL-like Lipase/Acylhydrolase family